MFEAAELGSSISKALYNKEVPVLRTRLLDVQQRLRLADFPVIIVFAGVDGAGKGETVDILNEWMDPRWLRTRAYGQPSDEESERPEFWRYWRDLPAKGTTGFFMSSWYSRPVLDRVSGKSNEAEFDQEIERIVAFERALANDGAMILKFWIHLGKKAQAERFKSLEKNPLTSWRVTKTDWANWAKYDKFVEAAERIISRTSKGRAPWQIVEGADFRFLSLTVATTIHDAIEKHLTEHATAKRITEEIEKQKDKKKNKKGKKSGLGTDANGSTTSPRTLTAGVSILSQLDMDQKVALKDYRKDLEALQGRLNRLEREAKAKGVSTVLVFEGWDAGGKGGAVRRITAALDSRNTQVIPIAAPTDEERVQHYLWRFWRHLSRAGRFTVFDRSWYGRVLVERIEGFATEAEWMRAYAEINEFEEQLIDHGIVLVKFWMHITKEEQLERFKQRQKIAYKRWKLTDEDWRNREKWDQYEVAVNDMVARTSTLIAPWTLVEGNNKRFARIKCISTVCDRLEQALSARREPERTRKPAEATPPEEARAKPTRPGPRRATPTKRTP